MNCTEAGMFMPPVTSTLASSSSDFWLLSKAFLLALCPFGVLGILADELAKADPALQINLVSNHYEAMAKARALSHYEI